MCVAPVQFGSCFSAQKSGMMAMGTLWLLWMVCASLECCREQRVTIKSCVSWGFEPRRIHNALVAQWEGDALSITQVRHWCRVFQADPTRTTADKKRCGRPRSQRTAAGIARVEGILDEERRSTIWDVAKEVGMSASTVLKVIHKDLKMKKIAPRWLPHHLTE